MTMDVHSTDGFEEELVEFALGILDGRARAMLVEHVEHCGDCAERLAQLSTTADLLMYVPVGAEPPLGFESGIIERIRATESARRWGPRRWQMLAAAAVVVVSFALGWTIDHALAKPAGPAQASSAVQERHLLANGRDVGTVYAYAGPPAWMFVSVDVAGAPSDVRCTVVTTSGARRFVGTFALARGRGAWGANLPVPFKSVRNVVLSSSSGAVVAQLSDSSWNYPTTGN